MLVLTNPPPDFQILSQLSPDLAHMAAALVAILSAFSLMLQFDQFVFDAFRPF
jgi:hypothetical protein